MSDHRPGVLSKYTKLLINGPHGLSLCLPRPAAVHTTLYALHGGVPFLMQIRFRIALGRLVLQKGGGTQGGNTGDHCVISTQVLYIAPAFARISHAGHMPQPNPLMQV